MTRVIITIVLCSLWICGCLNRIEPYYDTPQHHYNFEDKDEIEIQKQEAPEEKERRKKKESMEKEYDRLFGEKDK
jgi:hypothetical protein